MNVNDEYEYIFRNIIGVYRYIENDETERYWVDSQNCMYHTNEGGNEDYDEETDLIDGKNWWIIWPAKPIGYELTIEDCNGEWPHWYVIESSKVEDENKEWDFNKHCVK